MPGRSLGVRFREAGVAAPALAAAALGVFAGGGYSPTARLAFGVAAMAACAATLRIVREPLGRACREPLVMVLLTLAVLGAVSAAWTEGPVERTLRWALVTAGYAALAVAAGAVARRRGGVVTLTAGLAVIASVAAALGLASAAAGSDAFAVRIAGVWRPSGPFGYPPALALLVVSALPALLAAMRGRSRVLAGAAALGTALAGGVLALAASRTALALGIVVSGAGLATGRSQARRRRLTRAAPAALAALAVLVAIVAFGAAAGRGGGPGAGFLHGRSDTWRAAVETFADDPLKGAGADAFLAASARHQGGETIAFAHSLPLELAAELGVAGLALAVALYAVAGRLLWRNRDTAAGRLLGPAAAAFLVSSLLDWPWHLAGAGAVWAVAAGALAGSATAAQKRQGPGGATEHRPT